MSEYITIKEFCKLAKITPQSVYKRLKKENNPIQPFIKLVDGNKLISIDALELYKKPKSEAVVNEDIKKETVSDDTVNRDLIDMLRKELEEKSEQLKIKDKQIADLNDRLAESSQMLNQEQHLRAGAEQRLLMLEEKKEEVTTKKKWWNRFF